MCAYLKKNQYLLESLEIYGRPHISFTYNRPQVLYILCVVIKWSNECYQVVK